MIEVAVDRIADIVQIMLTFAGKLSSLLKPRRPQLEAVGDTCDDVPFAVRSPFWRRLVSAAIQQNSVVKAAPADHGDKITRSRGSSGRLLQPAAVAQLRVNLTLHVAEHYRKALMPASVQKCAIFFRSLNDWNWDSGIIHTKRCY